MFDPTPEDDAHASRRHFLRAAGALTVGTTCGPGLRPAPVIQIGILVGTFAGPTLEARLGAVKACGLDCVQRSLDL